MEWNLLENVYQILKEGNVIQVPNDEKVVDYKDPEELKKIIDFSLEDDETRSKSGPKDQLAEAEAICKQVVKYSVKTGHRFFSNQLFGGCDPFGLAASWITDALNTSQYTFEVGPVFTLMEAALVEKCLQLFGFESGDGIFNPGGSMSNMYAIILAKYKRFPEMKSEGLFNSKPLVLYTSDDAHYSMKKATHWSGIGLNNLVSVKTNSQGQMIPEELELAIQKTLKEDKIPFFVNGTAGTTVLGAFDDFESLSQVCSKYNLWFHIDACLGGSAILSSHKDLLRGCNKADSIAWNPHKSIGAPLQCSLLITKYKGLLHQCNSANADYLFQQDKFYDTAFDTGDKSFQCGRKVDAFKFWLMLKVRGFDEWRNIIDNVFRLKDYFMSQLKTNSNFRLLADSFQYTNICFWYIPSRLLGKEETPEWWDEIYKCTTKIKEVMIKKGSLMIGFCPLKHKGIGNFLRMVFTCFPEQNNSDVDDLIKEIQSLGELC